MILSRYSRVLAVVTDTVALAAVADERHKIYRIDLSAIGATIVKVTVGNDADDARIVHQALAANGSYTFMLNGPLELPLNTAVKVTSSANTVAVTIHYTTEAP